MTGGIYLLLGSNLGDKEKNLAIARQKLSNFCQLLRHSSIVQSEAWGNTHQPDFLNQVIEIETTLPPELLLQKTLAIELAMGRQRSVKWGERIIDIDLLLYRTEIARSSTLQIPHPEIPNRRFTLVPLCELAGETEHPLLHVTFKMLLQECPDPLQVKKIV